jgi:hypothetical protein
MAMILLIISFTPLIIVPIGDRIDKRNYTPNNMQRQLGGNTMLPENIQIGSVEMHKTGNSGQKIFGYSERICRIRGVHPHPESCLRESAVFPAWTGRGNMNKLLTEFPGV